jgi:hypothetical protein
VYASIGIPFKLVQTYDACTGTTRSIQWQIQSRMAFNVLPSTIVITAPWTFTPAPGTNPSTFYGKSVLPNDVFNIDYYNLTSPTGYGIHVTLTDAGNNNITDGATTGQSEMACGSHFMATKGVITSVYPNPAHNTLHVQAAAANGKTYVMQLTDISGKVLMTRAIKGPVNVDVSGYARGVYIVRFISPDKKEPMVFNKVVLN